MAYYRADVPSIFAGRRHRSGATCNLGLFVQMQLHFVSRLSYAFSTFSGGHDILPSLPAVLCKVMFSSPPIDNGATFSSLISKLARLWTRQCHCFTECLPVVRLNESMEATGSCPGRAMKGYNKFYDGFYVRFSHYEDDLLVVVLHLQSFELEGRTLALLYHVLVMDILDTRPDILGARWDWPVGVLVLLPEQTQPLQQR